MKYISEIRNYNSFYFKADITPRSPASGFSFAFGTTGVSPIFSTGIIFSGKSGLVFDQSGKFFGGYYSGRSFQIEGHFFGDRLSYFYNGTLVDNNIPIENSFNCIEFDKLENSELNLQLNYISGLVSEDGGLADSGGTLLLSREGFYLFPAI